MTFAPGTAVLVSSGAFEGKAGVVREVEEDDVQVALDLFGRETAVWLPMSELAPADGIALEKLEEAVTNAVRQRGFNQRREFFWRAELQRQEGRGLSREELGALARRHDAFLEGIRGEEKAAVEQALQAVRDTFAPLAPGERLQRWLAERARWTEWEEASRAALTHVPGYVPLPTGEGLVALMDGQRDLMRQVDDWRLEHELTTPSTEPREPGLEAAIDEAPERDAGFLVYGDWLLARGAARGDLVTAHAAGRTLPEVEHALLGPLRKTETFDATWRLGFLKSARIEATRAEERRGLDLAGYVSAAWAHPSFRFLERLELLCASAHETTVMERVFETFRAAGQRPSLRSLVFETNTEEEMLSWTRVPELTPVCAAFPRLQRLRVHAGSVTLGEIAWPALESLELHVTSLGVAELDSLAKQSWPALKHLGLWFGSQQHQAGVTAEQVLAVLTETRLPHLTSLGLANGEFADALCEGLTKLPLAKRLRALDLSLSTMTDRGAELLLSAGLQLDALDVRENYLSADALTALRERFPSVQSGDQREAELVEGEPRRYASVWE